MTRENSFNNFKGLIDKMTLEPKESEEGEAAYKALECLIDKLKKKQWTQEECCSEILRRYYYTMKKVKSWSEKEMKIVKRLIEVCPKMVTAKSSDSQYKDWIPLHMAICKGNVDLVKLFLQSPSVIEQKNDEQKNKEQKNETLFLGRATGDIFKQTVMMAEIPLSVAALTFRTDTVKVLLDRGAPIDGTNSLGDNVCHSLIRYATFYPEKVHKVQDMFVFLEREVNANDDERKAMAKVDIMKSHANNNEKAVKPKDNEREPKAKDDKKEANVKDNEKEAKAAKDNKSLEQAKDDKMEASAKDDEKETNAKDDDKVNWHKIWKMPNNKGLTPLQFAAKCGQHELFKYIMESEIYCSKDTEEGLFDIKNYDIQEIDTISWREENGELKVVPRPEKQSVLKILLELDSSEAFQFILIPPVYQVIYNKWAYYIKLFLAVWIFFLLFTGMLIWYCIERAQQEFNSPSGFDISEAPIFKSKITTQPFLTAFSVITTVVALILLCLEIYRYYLGRLEYKWISFTNPYSHGCFRVTLVLISVLLIIDLLAATLSSLYENCFLLVAVILVCFCNIFFIRVIEKFSFSTALITKVIVRDMVPFFVILAIESIAFSTAMFMAIQGSEVIDDINYSHYGRVLFSMATLMIGLGDTANFYDTRNAGLTIAIFIAFVIFTTLLMINSLIAMISKTCTELFENVRNVNALHLHWSLQILSMIQFFESILPERLFCNVGTIDKDDQRRYLLEVRSNKDLQPIVVAEPSKVNELTETDAGTCQRHVSMTPVGSSMDHPFREPRCMDLYLMTDKYHTMERTVKLSH